MTDLEIIEILRNNDIKGSTNALKTIYKNNYYMVEDYVKKNNGTKDDAKDLFQDSVIVLYKNIKKDSFLLSGKISTYLYSISRNLWLKKLRDTKIKTTEIDTHNESFSTSETIQLKIEYSENQIFLGRLLTKAGEKCKKILKAFYYDKQSMKTIAEMQGYSSEQVAKNQKLRCLKKIRSVLNEHGLYSEHLDTKF